MRSRPHAFFMATITAKSLQAQVPILECTYGQYMFRNFHQKQVSSLWVGQQHLSKGCKGNLTYCSQTIKQSLETLVAPISAGFSTSYFIFHLYLFEQSLFDNQSNFINDYRYPIIDWQYFGGMLGSLLLLERQIVAVVANNIFSPFVSKKNSKVMVLISEAFNDMGIQLCCIQLHLIDPLRWSCSIGHFCWREPGFRKKIRSRFRLIECRMFLNDGSQTQNQAR